MPALFFDISALRQQQTRLRHQGRLHWWHWLIVGFSVVITVVAWHTSQSLVDEKARQQFFREAERVVDLMKVRMGHYEDALLSGVAAMHANGGSMSREQWRTYAGKLDLASRYPGVGGIGVIRQVDRSDLASVVEQVRLGKPSFTVFPKHDFSLHLPIMYIEPESENAAAVGLDVAFETNRRTAALLARDLATTQISGPIVLVQDDGKTPGFLFYAPYYRDTQGFMGLIYAPLVVKRLVDGVLGSQHRQVTFTIRDGDSILYEDVPAGKADESGLQEKTLDAQLYGRTWSFDVRSTAAFNAGSDIAQPLVVLFSGLTVDAMLLILFMLMSRSNRRVLKLAARMTDELADQAQALSDKNQELENFAHVVSHDLKTPIRGIHSLTQFLEDDLGNYLASNEAHPDVQRNIDRLYEQVDKGNTLIQGILDYSVAGSDEEEQSVVDTNSLVREIGQTLGIRDEQLRIVDQLPVFTTRAVRFGQVLANLIGNSFKYHHDIEHATICVSVEERGDYYRFSVADDGPGILERFHARVFEPFTTLGIKSGGDSSGIGLSIVKKSVERLGGQVDIESAPGVGTTIRFDWPNTTHEIPVASRKSA